MLAHPSRTSVPAVEVVYSIGEWFVRTSDGVRNTVHTFDRESFALAFAEEEMARLGAGEIVMSDADRSDPLRAG